MTVALDNFVKGVADDANQDARAAPITALGTSDPWVKDYTAKLSAGGSPLLTHLAALDPALLDPLILAMFVNPTLKQELLKLLNQTNPPPAWLADVVGLLAKDGAVIDAYVKTLTTDAATSGTPSKLAEKLDGVTPSTDLDAFIQALAAKSHLRAELVKVLGSIGDWVTAYLKTLADDTGTVSPAGQLVADKLNDFSVKALDVLLGALAAEKNIRPEMVKVLGDMLATDDVWLAGYVAALTGGGADARNKLAAALGKVAHDHPFDTLKSLVEALTADADVLAGLGKTLGDKDHAALFVKLIAVITPTTTAKDVATFLKDRPDVRGAAVTKTTLPALLLALEQAGAMTTTADFAKIIQKYEVAKPLRLALGVPEPPPSQLVAADP